MSQNLTVPSYWRKPNVSLPLANRTILANKALSILSEFASELDIIHSDSDADKIALNISDLGNFTFSENTSVVTVAIYIPQNVSVLHNDGEGGLIMGPTTGSFTVGIEFGDPATLCSQMVLFDQLTSQTSYNSTVIAWLRTVYHQVSAFRNINLYTTLRYGQTATRAYMYYGGEDYLAMAQSAWEVGWDYTITPAQAETGMLPTKNFTIGSKCRNSVVGGTFSKANQTDASMETVTSGEFLLLSSLLASATSNSTYIEAVSLSFEFLSTPFRPDSNPAHTAVFQAGWDASGCDLIPEPISAPLTLALLLEGMVLFANTTGNTTQRNSAANFLVNATVMPQWTDNQGILLPQYIGYGSSRLVGVLSTAYQLKFNDSVELQNYIKSFISVQYNGIIDLASSEPYAYGESWDSPSGPPSFTTQASAVEVLLAGMAMVDPSASSHALSSPYPFNIGAIVGGAASGILCVLAIIVFMTFRRRRQRNAALLVPRPLFTTRDFFHDSHSRAAFLRAFMGKPKARKELAGNSRPIENNISRELRPSDISREPIEEIAPSLVEGATVVDESPVLGGRAGGFTNLTVPEMVRVLNDRLRQGDVVWDEDEAPPIYGQSAYGQSETDR